MEDRYTIAEAKNKLPAIVHSVEEGSRVTLTRYGRPVAVLLSIGQFEKLSREGKGFWQALETLREQMRKENIHIFDTDFEHLRDESSGRRVELE
ncbi:MAG: type II toxin-antitoxin system Phd/YefM family antitoxin [Syntrophobacteraceae bacterium]